VWLQWAKTDVNKKSPRRKGGENSGGQKRESSYSMEEDLSCLLNIVTTELGKGNTLRPKNFRKKFVEIVEFHYYWSYGKKR
jgi:hypothetical protein